MTYSEVGSDPPSSRRSGPDCLISVQPRGSEWVVRIVPGTGEVITTSGAAAEILARHIAHAFAESGNSTEIEIHLRGGAVAARFVVSPAV